MLVRCDITDVAILIYEYFVDDLVTLKSRKKTTTLQTILDELVQLLMIRNSQLSYFGNRHHLTASVCEYLVQKGYPLDDVLDFLKRWTPLIRRVHFNGLNDEE